MNRARKYFRYLIFRFYWRFDDKKARSVSDMEHAKAIKGQETWAFVKQEVLPLIFVLMLFISLIAGITLLIMRVS